MEKYYRKGDMPKKFESITEKGKNLQTIEPEQLKKGNINDDKKRLLLYNENTQREEKFKFFKDFIEENTELGFSPNQHDNKEDTDDWDCNEEAPSIVYYNKYYFTLNYFLLAFVIENVGKKLIVDVFKNNFIQ